MSQNQKRATKSLRTTQTIDVATREAVDYYDSNYNLIAQGYNSGTAISGTSNFNQMSNLSILGEHSINEIYYYRLSINISGTTNSSGTINSSSLTPSKNCQYSS